MGKVEIFYVLQDNFSLLMRTGFECSTRNHEQRVFRKVWARHIKNFDHKMNS